MCYTFLMLTINAFPLPQIHTVFYKRACEKRHSARPPDLEGVLGASQTQRVSPAQLRVGGIRRELQLALHHVGSRPGALSETKVGTRYFVVNFTAARLTMIKEITSNFILSNTNKRPRIHLLDI